MLNKPVVHYLNTVTFLEQDGHKFALVCCMDHPSARVTNGKTQLTSRIVAGPTDNGVFETEYSIYHPLSMYKVGLNPEVDND